MKLKSGQKVTINCIWNPLKPRGCIYDYLCINLFFQFIYLETDSTDTHWREI